ncbi:DUF1102 family protein [Halalkaliarchaeum sp. AArc-CO]|uniref:hypothetical protein n=1 Tax=Halalkaliarchaeum sp. AArc-CO TaxID=2866381 RepID=UPI00217D4EAB|nr:hypothetical protein [Halalkaliarchaeum sp. AArc-CO]UWG50670.1 DUF1102 family protein [Halalkaliarchaeum sp. AArc-CO]
MERRKLLIGMGSLAVGGAAAMGSGAFTSVEADRTVQVDVANDANAFLALEGKDTPNGNEYVANDGTSGTLTLDFSSTSEGGNGLNQNGETIIRDLFEIHNQGTQEVVVGVTDLPDGMSIYADDDDVVPPEGITLNQDAQGAGSNNLPRLDAGESLTRVGVIFRVDDELGDGGPADALLNFDGTITINAYTEDEV